MRKFFPILLLLLQLTPLAARPIDPVLPHALQVDMKRIAETWHILDCHAQTIWPGWSGFRDVPFLIAYPNGMELLIGHPSPPDGFQRVPGTDVDGKAVYLNRTHADQSPMHGPFNYGGGIIRYGKTKSLPTINIKAGAGRYEADLSADETPPQLRNASDKTILMYLHELFHVYQGTIYNYRYGNLQYNPTTNFAVYADVEGQALEAAYLATDASEQRARLADFLAARKLKRNAMTVLEGQQEAEDELLEGTATYVEARAAELLNEGFVSTMKPGDDPQFRFFNNASFWIDQKRIFLQKNREQSLEARNNCYFEGCFQALLLSRLAPGWQRRFFQAGDFLETVIDSVLGLTPEAMQAASAGLETRYAMAALRTKHSRQVESRDAAFNRIDKRSGRTFIVNFKPIKEYVTPDFRGECYKMGLKELAEAGIKKVELFDILFEGRETPMIKDQLYYIKWVDTTLHDTGKGYTLEYNKKIGSDIYTDATLTTEGFTLKAPKIKVTDRQSRVKISILAKIRE